MGCGTWAAAWNARTPKQRHEATSVFRAERVVEVIGLSVSDLEPRMNPVQPLAATQEVEPQINANLRKFTGKENESALNREWTRIHANKKPGFRS